MKKQLFVLLTAFLVGCSTNHSQSESLGSNISKPSENDAYVPYTYKTRVSEYDFSNAIKALSNSYEDHIVKMEEVSYFVDENEKENNYALISFDNVSSQTTFPGYPILNAYGKDSSTIRYVNLMSSSTFNIHEVSLDLSLWSKGDKENIPNTYYLGLEYLKNDNWVRSSSINIENLTIGRNDDSVPFTFLIEEDGITNVRIAFDFINAQNNVRFALYSLSLKGNERIINDNPNIQSISFEENELVINENETFLLNPIVTSSDENKFIKFLSSDRSIITVSDDGVVTGLSVGEATITARNGNIEDSINIIVIKENQNYKKIIQNIVNFNGEIPSGFSSNFETYFSGTYLNFKEQGNYVITPKYENITGETVVTLNMMLSSSSDIDLSSENIFTVEGLNSEGEVIESVQKTNLINTKLEDIEFEFKSNEIKQYRLIFEYKHILDQGSYYKTGKNYCLNSLIIYQK
ncbi:MAG: Ig-like domain-containing protein [Erysipelotrichales bacterium]|nr:Ig-like domain-containing protein [Erysipelotrichales bacterium]